VIIAVTFGFDEKFAIRALMRHPPYGQYKGCSGGGFEPLPSYTQSGYIYRGARPTITEAV
jgi:hypothetical protein